MSDIKSYEQIKELLTQHGQQHLLAFYDELDEKQQQKLLSQLSELDFVQIDEWAEKYVKNDSPMEVPSEFEPAPSYPAEPEDDKQAATYKQAVEKGVKLLENGKVAGFTVAGGQGTRLGFSGPKGNYPISPVKQKTLFQLFAETVAAASAKFGAAIPWYIMTSPLNHAETVETFEQSSYFGLNPDNVFIFQQGTNINFSLDGKILLAEKDKLATSPDGHGGSLKALHVSGAIADMKKRGVEYISYWQVDNPLVRLFDPLFIGLHAKNNAGMSSKALIKAYPTEKVGNFCLVDGKVTVIEYSDLPEDDAHRQNPDGSLVFELGSIAIHIVSVDFVEKLNAHGFALPIHRAVKKIPHINEKGEKVKPEEPNGVKLETFVFDALPLADESIILETVREEEFAPVKNAEGTDSPAVTKQMMTERAAKWLEAAGIQIPRNSEGKPDCVIEMAPSFAIFPEDVEAKKAAVPDIKPGDEIYLD
ncbi:putative uridylyltransferase [Anaerohalosphaera lusitana]|uniref:Putative uridylyltransferase n=1 Tax=Anaerohalosphaera lusitana TaxID=1936003 RepID=A0A1U9NKN9_9BACT|nr:UDPGP type 1 family protein [Anaerohalosphaera lusitana]AQT68375.1 putative uridylyltransferase [Anaerohalosphaera lusitana]